MKKAVMTRAEESASKAYGGVPQLRIAFIHGYEQAEKDLALTADDMKYIVNIADELVQYYEVGIKDPALKSEQTFYEEVLRRFNEIKKQHK